MNMIYLLKMFNWCFLLTGNGSVKYNGKNWMLRNYAWRFILACIFFINIYNGHQWATHHVLKLLEPISIVMIASIVFRLVGPFFSIVWRLFTDDRLSDALKKFISMHEVLRHLNIEVTISAATFQIFLTGLTIHFIIYIVSVIGFSIIPDYYILDWAMWSCTFVFNRCMFYEYMSLVTYVRIIVHKINGEISKGAVPMSELERLHTVTLDGLEHVNRSVFGAPVLVNIIAGNVSSVIYMLYHYVLFRGMFVKVDVPLFYPILDVALKSFDTILLYWLCRTIEKEVTRTTLVLHQRFITETNQKVRRKIAFFSLRRLHADFKFTLCGFYKINYRQLLLLLSKAITFLVIQIQFKIHSISEAFE